MINQLDGDPTIGGSAPLPSFASMTADTVLKRYWYHLRVCRVQSKYEYYGGIQTTLRV